MASSFVRFIPLLAAALAVLLIQPSVQYVQQAEAQVLRSAEGMRTRVQFGVRYTSFQPRAGLGTVSAEDGGTVTGRMRPARGVGVALEVDRLGGAVGLRLTVDRLSDATFVARLDGCDTGERECVAESVGPLWHVSAGPVYRPRPRTANVQPFAAAGLGLVRHSIVMGSSLCRGGWGVPLPLQCSPLTNPFSDAGRLTTANAGAGLDLRLGHALVTANTSAVLSRYRLNEPLNGRYTVGRRNQFDWLTSFGVRLGIL